MWRRGSQGSHAERWGPAPSHRQRGVGRLLVDAVIDWALERGARQLLLMVTSNNRQAITFYERMGFTRTGRTEPYPNDASLCEYEMEREITRAAGSRR